MKRNRTLNVERLEDRQTPSTLPAGFTEQVIAVGLDNPASMEVAKDGRVFIALQKGDVRIVQDGALLATQFLHVDTRSNGEVGLLGFTLDPNFDTNGYVYVYYRPIVATGAAEFNRVSRFTAVGNVVDPGSEQVLMDLDLILPPAENATHNGGAMHFGLDGKLYIATGENAYGQLAQSLSSTTGKILRINSDGTIPDDNPTRFQGIGGTTSGKYRSIYAVGFRNPFTFDVQPGTGRIFINDVGSSSFEEINELLPGRNYGWPYSEGFSNNPNITDPIFVYAHGAFGAEGYSLAITGAAFYNPPLNNFPSPYTGDFFYADFVGNYIKNFDPATGQATLFANNLTRGGVVDLDVASNGDFYYLARGETGLDGGVYRIRFSNLPAIAVQPASVRLNRGESATLSVAANGAGPLRYQWMKNGVEIAGATASTYRLSGVTFAEDQSEYVVRVSNAYGTIESTAAMLRVTPSSPPTAQITSPARLYVSGETFTVTGQGFDPETGRLPGSSLTWTVDYHTGDAAPRPFVTATPGDSVTFTIPTVSPYTLADVYYRVTLTARDADGSIAIAIQDLKPVTAEITVAASAPGVDVLLSGQPVGQIHTYLGVAGIERTLDVPTEVTVEGVVWPFIGWFDGETSPSRTFSTPSTNATYLAIYKQPVEKAAGVAVGAGFGGGPLVKQYDGQGQLQSERFAFDPRSRNGVSVAMADFTGDGVADTAAGNGPGGPPLVTIFDGATGLAVRTFLAFEAGFVGGVNLNAADFDGDGKAELILAPGFGGGPRIRIVHANSDAALVDFFGIADETFRGGARATVGDLNGDGQLDLVVAAGSTGGPRIAGWDGLGLLHGQFVRAFDDFFAFDPNLRGGTYVSMGDVNGDGVDDLILGAGFDGGPNVRVIYGSDTTVAGLDPSNSEEARFFVGDPKGRSGIRVLARDLDGDGRAEIVTGTGENQDSTVTVVDDSGLTLATWEIFPFPLEGGIMVG